MKFITILLLQFFFISSLTAQLQLSKIFGDHMVLQRNQEITVWGWHKKGEHINVSFDQKEYKTKSNKNGEWGVKLPRMMASGPFEMKISSGAETVVLKDIMVGDVWVCSGQSNMEWIVRNSNNAALEMAAANDARIRHFKVPLSYADTPENQLAGGEWKVTTPETVGEFTAVGYFFAKNICEKEEVTIGLLNTSWGGSRIEPWMSSEALQIKNPEAYLSEIQAKENANLLEKLEMFKKDFPNITTTDQGIVGGAVVWANPDLDIQDWKKMQLPALWEEQGYDELDGIVWFRTTVYLSAEEANNPSLLGLAQIDDSDYVYINGVKVGETIQSHTTVRAYKIDPMYFFEGENVITVRVEDTGGGGGIYGDPANLFLKTSKQAISLAKAWDFKIGAYRASTAAGKNQIPMLLYNKMIYPIVKYPIKGALWYQGESNAGTLKEAKEYESLFKTMIHQWRKDWKVGEFPFLFVQLANYMAVDATPSESSWAVLRESQSKTLEVPNTGQAVIIDIGEANDIHPRNKQDVGYRLALAAEKIAYGKDLVYSGPTYKSYEIEKNSITIQLDHKGSGLMAKDKYGYLRGFAIAGSDGKFYWAKAEIKEEAVEVWSHEVANPKYVRYAWGNNPDDANLYNREGLPTNPFRTDSLN